jgi:hypothetical protein
MKSIFEETTYNTVIARINSLHENSERQWGKMTVAQMAWHCQFPFVIGIKNKNNGNGNLFVRLFFKKQMFTDKPFRKNLPTVPNLKTKKEKDLPTEKAILRQLVTDFYDCRNRKDWNPHPLFGKLTHEQWGKMEYKHVDHHLTQFGV